MHDSHASGSTPPFDPAIAALAASQHGVVSLRQLREIGLGRGAIAHRLKIGRLHRVHPGVYAVGHAILSPRGRFMAATLAAGANAVLSHRSAARLHGLLDSASARIEVSTPRRRRPGSSLRGHQTRTLTPADVTIVDGIPVTSVARTLLDLGDVAPPRHVERAVDQAEILRVFDLGAIDDVLARARGRHGATVLRAALERHRDGPALTRSGLEEAFLALVDAAGLPRPRTNARLCGYEVDAYWPGCGLVVELDSFRYHRSRRAFEADRRRDIALQAAGLRIARVTDRRIAREPGAVLDELRALVDSGPGRSS